jgi:hypothetical protein
MEEFRWLDLLQEFVDYRSEKDSKWKEKRQKERTWDTNLRLKKWKKNKDTNFWRIKQIDYEQPENFHKARITDPTPIKDFFKNKYWNTLNWEYPIRQIKYNEAKKRYKQTDLYLKY